MKFKNKITLGVLSTAALLTPLIAVISCGNNNSGNQGGLDSKEDTKPGYNGFHGDFYNNPFVFNADADLWVDEIIEKVKDNSGEHLKFTKEMSNKLSDYKQQAEKVAAKRYLKDPKEILRIDFDFADIWTLANQMYNNSSMSILKMPKNWSSLLPSYKNIKLNIRLSGLGLKEIDFSGLKNSKSIIENLIITDNEIKTIDTTTLGNNVENFEFYNNEIKSFNINGIPRNIKSIHSDYVIKNSKYDIKFRKEILAWIKNNPKVKWNGVISSDNHWSKAIIK